MNTPRATRDKVAEEECIQEERRATAITAACLLLSGNLPIPGVIEPEKAALDIADVFVMYLRTGKRIDMATASVMAIMPELDDLKGDGVT